METPSEGAEEAALDLYAQKVQRARKNRRSRRRRAEERAARRNYEKEMAAEEMGRELGSSEDEDEGRTGFVEGRGPLRPSSGSDDLEPEVDGGGEERDGADPEQVGAGADTASVDPP